MPLPPAIATFDQTQAMNIAQPAQPHRLGPQHEAANLTSRTDGACHTFCMKWISLILNDDLGPLPAGLLSAFRMRRLHARGGGAVALIQLVSKGVFDQNTLFHFCHFFNLKADGEPINHQPFVFGVADLTIRAQHNAGMIYSFWFTDRPQHAGQPAPPVYGHSVAFYRMRNRLHAFDPNYGESIILTTQVNQYLRQLEQRYCLAGAPPGLPGGQMQDHWLGRFNLCLRGRNALFGRQHPQRVAG